MYQTGTVDDSGEEHILPSGNRPRVSAVIPLYRPPAEVVANISSALSQCDAVVCVDDGSGSGFEEIFDALEAKGAKLIRSSTNRGIASTLNTAVSSLPPSTAREYVLTLDQDSSLSTGYVERMLSMLHSLDWQARVIVPGEIAGVRVRTRRGQPSVPEEPIQSGAMFERDVMAEVGGFREELFIDAVDTEYFGRLASMGVAIVVARNVSLYHQLGETISTFPGRPGIGYHPPERLFYITRNNLLLLAETRDRRYQLRRATGRLADLLVRLTFGPERRRQLRAVREGYAAYRSRDFGRIGVERLKRIER